MNGLIAFVCWFLGCCIVGRTYLLLSRKDEDCPSKGILWFHVCMAAILWPLWTVLTIPDHLSDWAEGSDDE